MAKSLLVAFLCVSLISCEPKEHKTHIELIIKEDSIAYIQKCITFIRQIKKRNLSDTNFILADKPFSFKYSNCIESILSDTNFYTKDELIVIKNRKYSSLTKWTNEFFKNTRLVSSDTIEAILETKSRGWEYFHNNIGYGFSRFSIPIFLRNDTYCLFYADHNCVARCGEGGLTLYKKEKGEWIEVKHYCQWVG